MCSNEYQSGVCVQPAGNFVGHLSIQPASPPYFNYVAIAAQYAIKKHKLKKILIVDWDIDHGHGTQEIFSANNKVLYISLHRYDKGSLCSTLRLACQADHTYVGERAGEGYSVNIPWNKVNKRFMMSDLFEESSSKQTILNHFFCPIFIVLENGRH